MFAIASLLLVAAISLLITRIATVILTASGMSRESARFQARSAFTGAGFTTSEAEHAVDHPLRRRVIATLMLLGNVGVVAAASSTILGFRGGAFGHARWRVLELVAGLIALVIISRSNRVDRWLTSMISRVLRRWTDLTTRDVARLLKLSGEYAVHELAVNPGDWLAGRTLAGLRLRDEGVVVLGLTRPGGRFVGAPSGSTELRPGDLLVAYGRGEQLRDLDERPAGATGDRAHRDATARQHRDEMVALAADRPATHASEGADRR